MKTFLTIALSLIAAGLTYHFVICHRLCPSCPDPKDSNVGEYQLKATDIYFKGFNGSTVIELEHVVKSKTVFSGKFYPYDLISHSFKLWNGDQLKYKMDQDTSFHIIEWQGSQLDSNLFAYIEAVVITPNNSGTLCPSSILRSTSVSLSPNLSTFLIGENLCQSGLRVCEDGNPANCMNVQIDELFSIRVAVDQTTCRANGLNISCQDGTPLGRFRFDDPDDLNIRIVLGGTLDIEFAKNPILIDSVGSDILNH